MDKQLSQIDWTRPYEGFVWMSDENRPHEYDGAVVNTSIFGQTNPFIAEAQLFDRELGKSYTIRMVDGCYQVWGHTVRDEDWNSELVDRECYCMKRTKHRYAEYLRYWKEEDDELALSMPQLRMEKMIFVGFKHKEENV